jgi:hypothetical protein
MHHLRPDPSVFHELLLNLGHFLNCRAYPVCARRANTQANTLQARKCRVIGDCSLFFPGVEATSPETGYLVM